MEAVSIRAQVITRRTYNRPLNIEGTKFETWEQTIGRVIAHQRMVMGESKRRNSINRSRVERISRTSTSINR